MKYVYLLQSISHPEQRYVGLTSDPQKRLAAHNSGQSTHTAKFVPRELVTFLAFTEEFKAVEFEKYLKSGSGRAFAISGSGNIEIWQIPHAVNSGCESGR